MDSDAPIANEGWIFEAYRTTRDELKFYLLTLIATCLHPVAFGRAWSRNERRAMNPFGFFALSCALATIPNYFVYKKLAPYVSAFHHATHNMWQVPDWAEPLTPILRDYLGSIMSATIIHGVLRLLGSKAPWQKTLAISFYGSGLHMLFIWATVPFQIHLAGVDLLDRWRYPTSYIESFLPLVGIGVTTAILKGVHEVRWYKAILAVGILMLIFGAVGIAFGLHFVR